MQEALAPETEGVARALRACLRLEPPAQVATALVSSEAFGLDPEAATAAFVAAALRSRVARRLPRAGKYDRLVLREILRRAEAEGQVG
jgi:hypothetical protein